MIPFPCIGNVVLRYGGKDVRKPGVAAMLFRTLCKIGEQFSEMFW